jgi:hypothetical protein
MFVGSFDSSFTDFQFHVDAAVKKLKQGGATRLLIDLTNNPGKSSLPCSALFAILVLILCVGRWLRLPWALPSPIPRRICVRLFVRFYPYTFMDGPGTQSKI